MPLTIRQRLESIEEEFLYAVAEGDSALEQFDTKWTTLRDDSQHAIKAHLIDEETINLVYTTASRIAVLAESFSDVQQASDVIGSDLTDELNRLLSGLVLDDGPDPSPSLSPTKEKSSSPSSPSPAPTKEKLLPSLPDSEHLSPAIVSSCHWLLQNLHNPYPSSTIKREFAALSGLSSKAISKWFKDFRTHISWTPLVQHHFHGSRRAATDAAFRAYVRPDHTNPLAPDVLSEFADIRSKATSTIMNILDVHSDTQTTPPLSHSPSSSRSPSPPLRSSHFERNTPSSSLSHGSELGKRRLISPIPHDLEDLISTPQRKRKCISSDEASWEFYKGRPSVEAAAVELNGVALPASPTCREYPPYTFHSRKRQLSESDGDRDAKRTRYSSPTPRSQSASCPIPSAIEGQHQFAGNKISFECDAISTDLTHGSHLEPAEPLDVEVFNDWVSICNPSYDDNNVARTSTMKAFDLLLLDAGSDHHPCDLSLSSDDVSRILASDGLRISQPSPLEESTTQCLQDPELTQLLPSGNIRQIPITAQTLSSLTIDLPSVYDVDSSLDEHAAYIAAAQSGEANVLDEPSSRGSLFEEDFICTVPSYSPPPFSECSHHITTPDWHDFFTLTECLSDSARTSPPPPYQAPTPIHFDSLLHLHNSTKLVASSGSFPAFDVFEVQEKPDKYYADQPFQASQRIDLEIRY